MYYFEPVSQFHQRTGEKLEDRYDQNGIICDFCGKIYTQDPDNDKGRYISYSINDLEYIEQSYYYDECDKRIDKSEIVKYHRLKPKA